MREIIAFMLMMFFSGVIVGLMICYMPSNRRRRRTDD